MIGLLIDIPGTVYLFNKYPKGRKAIWMTPYVTVLAYVISAIFWMQIYSTAHRFQGQGALGMAVFLGLGILFSLIRLLFGVLVTVSRKINSSKI